MTDKTGFSLEFNVNPSTGMKPLPDLVAFDLCRAYPFSDGNLLLHNTQNGQRALVKPEVFASLLKCSQFRTLDQHVTSIIEHNPGMQGQQEDIRKVFQTMLQAGIMVSAKNVINDLKRRPETTNTTPALPIAAIITWERPQALERLLASIIANCDGSKFQKIYVIDDSRKAENILENQALVRKYAPELDATLVYFGQGEQRSFLEGLVKSLPHHENAVRFLADQSGWRDHFTAGLSRNWALLLSCGRRLVMMDDDSICDVHAPVRAKPNITFADVPRETDFFASEQEWASWRQPINPDPLDRHMQCLGLTFSEALEVLGENHLKPAGLADATALLTSELKADSPVLATQCGSLGCPGSATNTWLPDMAPASLQQMLTSPEKTDNALNSRLAWSGSSHPHFSPRPNMSQITGLDNRHTLPPYLPIIRGEDRLFGNMLDYMFPSSVSLDYPWAIPHLPIPQRTWQKEDLDFSTSGTFPLFFIEQVIEQKSYCNASSPLDRINSLAAWFAGLAAASDRSLDSMYRDTCLYSSSESLLRLNELLAEAENAPVNWREYLKNGVDQVTGNMDQASRGDFPLKGFPANLEGQNLVSFWRDTWAGFADALTAWPEIRRAAAKITETQTTNQ